MTLSKQSKRLCLLLNGNGFICISPFPVPDPSVKHMVPDQAARINNQRAAFKKLLRRSVEVAKVAREWGVPLHLNYFKIVLILNRMGGV